MYSFKYKYVILFALHSQGRTLPKFKFAVITIFPEIFSALKHGITGQALSESLYELTCINPRFHSDNPRGYIDDRPFGGGPGMVMTAPVMDASINTAKALLKPHAAVINLSPHGYPITQKTLDDLLKTQELIFICGRYEGIDQRVIDEHATHHICLADIILSGGEIAALACIDALVRQIPGVLKNPESKSLESFQGELLDHPHYTKPIKYKKYDVPTVLLSGDHARIHAWRKLEAEKLTKKFRQKHKNEDKRES